MERRNEFLKKLKALFEEYNASVGFESLNGYYANKNDIEL